MKKTLLVSSFLTVFVTSTAFAGSALPPSISTSSGGGSTAVMVGGTGSINTPHALSLGAGKFAISYHDLAGNTTLSQAHFGIDGNFEIGVTSYNLGESNEATYGNIKYQFVKETAVTPAIAVGVLDISDKYGRNAYIAGTKSLSVIDARVTLGAYQKGDNKVFGSIEKTFSFLPGGKNLFPSTTVRVEYDSEDINYGISLATIPGLKIDAGSRNKHGYIGATYTFN